MSDSTPWSLYTTALSMQVRLLARVEGNPMLWLKAIDAFLANDAREGLTCMGGAKVGAWAVRHAVARKHHATDDAARAALVAELAAVKGELAKPLEAVREARGVLLRALSSDDAARIDGALWALGIVCARAVLEAKVQRIDAAKAARR